MRSIDNQQRYNDLLKWQKVHNLEQPEVEDIDFMLWLLSHTQCPLNIVYGIASMAPEKLKLFAYACYFLGYKKSHDIARLEHLTK